MGDSGMELADTAWRRLRRKEFARGSSKHFVKTLTSPAPSRYSYPATRRHIVHAEIY